MAQVQPASRGEGRDPAWGYWAMEVAISGLENHMILGTWGLFKDSRGNQCF